MTLVFFIILLKDHRSAYFWHLNQLSDIKDHFEMITELPENASDSKIKNKCFIAYILTIDTPLGCPGGSIDPGEPIEFDFLGCRCDHKALKSLETKSL